MGTWNITIAPTTTRIKLCRFIFCCHRVFLQYYLKTNWLMDTSKSLAKVIHQTKIFDCLGVYSDWWQLWWSTQWRGIGFSENWMIDNSTSNLIAWMIYFLKKVGKLPSYKQNRGKCLKLSPSVLVVVIHFSLHKSLIEVRCSCISMHSYFIQKFLKVMNVHLKWKHPTCWWKPDSFAGFSSCISTWNDWRQTS